MKRPSRMNQEERSERSRAQVLDAALELFSHRGYRATSMRDIADRAGVSTGAVYHHFNDKETMFRALLDQYFDAIDRPDFPFNKALATGAFPDNLEALGRAARESVVRFRRHVALIYVDVVEFEGSHIRRFYTEMARRFEAFIAAHPELHLADKLRDGISPVAAMMLASRVFLQHFAVEIVFGVPDHYGKSGDDIVREIADILRRGMLKEQQAESVVSSQFSVFSQKR